MKRINKNVLLFVFIANVLSSCVQKDKNEKELLTENSEKTNPNFNRPNYFKGSWQIDSITDQNIMCSNLPAKLVYKFTTDSVKQFLHFGSKELISKQFRPRQTSSNVSFGDWSFIIEEKSTKLIYFYQFDEKTKNYTKQEDDFLFVFPQEKNKMILGTSYKTGSKMKMHSTIYLIRNNQDLDKEYGF